MRALLDQLEEKLLDLDQRKQILLLLLIPLVMFALFYYLYVDGALQELESKRAKIAALQKDLHKNSPREYLNKIRQKKKAILQAKTDLDRQKQQYMLYGVKLKKMKFLFVDSKDFNIFLESLLRTSLESNFTLDDLVISDIDKKFQGMLRIRKHIDLKGSGEFLNTLHFIRGIESSGILMSINNIVVTTDGLLPKTTLSIDFYGVQE